MTQKKNIKLQNKTGPKPEIVKIDGNWEDAMNKALKKERPKGGWPEPEKKEKCDSK